MDDRHLIVGLGNPGASYCDTRHNLGFAVVDTLARGHDISLDRKKFRAEYGRGTIRGQAVLLSKPQTYMNRSGQSVGVMAGWHRIPPQRVIVIHDDLDLDVGRLKLKSGGGHGGHNGLRDIQTALGSPEFQRVRMGIGRSVQTATDHVLSRFHPDEREAVEQMVERASSAVESIRLDGIDKAMN